MAPQETRNTASDFETAVASAALNGFPALLFAFQPLLLVHLPLCDESDFCLFAESISFSCVGVSSVYERVSAETAQYLVF